MGVYKLSAAGSVLTNRTEYKSMNAGNMYGAMVPIANFVISGTVTYFVTFTNIPQTYQDLFLVQSMRSDYAANADQILYRVGNTTLDTGNNYSNTYLSGDGSTASSSRQSNDNWIRGGFSIAGATATSGIFSANTMHILNYANTSTNKTTLQRNAIDLNGSGQTSMYCNLWRSTSAINTLQVFCGNGYFVAGSTATLYGIRAVSS
jgi:heat shock protein HslJ